MRRYFMTIPEAVQLVLQAGALGRGGEVFVLDMGEPIRIVDLATDLVRLSGLEVGRDIEIRYTGIRPGERLYEEPFFRHEEVLPTGHPKILRATDNHVPADVGSAIERLVAAGRESCSDEELRYQLKSLVPDFGEPPPDERRERPRTTSGARVWRGHVPAAHTFIERRVGLDRRGDKRRTHVVAVSVERREAAERRVRADRRAPLPVAAVPSGARFAVPALHTAAGTV